MEGWTSIFSGGWWWVRSGAWQNLWTLCIYKGMEGYHIKLIAGEFDRLLEDEGEEDYRDGLCRQAHPSPEPGDE